jgi:hypothetical protein
MVATSSNEDLDFGFVPVPIRRSLLKGPRLAPKSIFRGAHAKFFNRLLQCACRQGVVAVAEDALGTSSCNATLIQLVSSARLPGGICEIVVNARFGPELDHARSERTPGIA